MRRLAVILLILTWSGSSWAAYCASTHTNTTDDWIVNVTFAGINNTTGQDGALSYGAYTSLTASVNISTTYTLSIQARINGGWTHHVWAWFDWNADEDFEDAGESYDLISSTGLCQPCDALTKAIAVPAGAATGETRFRVMEKYNADPDSSCDTTQYAETEDYTVDIAGSTFSFVGSQASTSNAAAGSDDQAILMLTINGPDGGTWGIGDIDVTMQNTSDGHVDAAMAYWSTDNIFEPGTDTLKQTTADPTGTVAFTIGESGLAADATYYVFIAFDIDATAAECAGNTVDAYFAASGVTLTGTDAGDYTPSGNDPSGSRTIGDGCLQTYCASSYSNTVDDWISNVTFNNIDNDSGADGYGGYTSITTAVTAGSTYTLSIAPTINGGWTHHVWAWIDWNYDGDHADAGETYDLISQDGTCAPCAPVTQAIGIPSTAKTGVRLLLRTIEKYNGDPAGPCESDSYGETEDYVIVVNGAAPPVAQTCCGGTRTRRAIQINTQ